MIQRPLLNNMKNYKKRDSSMEQGTGLKQSLGQKLPAINVQQKCLKKEGGSRPSSNTRVHTRIASFDQRKMQVILKSTVEPKQQAHQNLLSDYGHQIDAYLKQTEVQASPE
jgi:hypothetical protein